jgi:hypothetical protein
LPDYDDTQLTLRGSGHAAAWALYASLFDPPVHELQLSDLPKTHQDGLTLLNVSRVVDFPSVIERAAKRAKLTQSQHDELSD